MLSDSQRSVQCAWQPHPFVRSVPRADRAAFVAKHPQPFLLVHLHDAEGELELGLTAANKLGAAPDASAPKRQGDELGFATVAHGQATVRRMMNEIRVSGELESKPLDIPREHLSERRFLVPLCKRGADTVFMERVTVGRARNNDIVLRHKTVSKFHAWWEYDATGVLWLRDAESKNFSMVNGSLLQTERVRIEMGAKVRFGSVDCTVCSAETVWDLLAGK